LYKNFGTSFPKFFSSNSEKIHKTHSEVFSKTKKFRKHAAKYLLKGKNGNPEGEKVTLRVGREKSFL
jgi:hypothetical protein